MARLLMRASERKRKLVEKFGGGCSVCGYDDSMRALAFYRRGRKIRKLSANCLWSATWDRIVRDARRCRLLCVNCLAEVLERRAKIERRK